MELTLEFTGNPVTGLPFSKIARRVI